MAGLRHWADRQVAVMLADYFPRPLSILDRDVSLGIVQATLDYGQQFGLTRPDATDVLVLDESGAVSVHALSPWMTMRCVYRIPIGLLTTIAGMRHGPSVWVRTDLRRMLDDIAERLTTDLDALTDADLVAMANSAVDARVTMFTSRRRHFLPSFAIKIVADRLARVVPRLTRGVFLIGDSPTAVFRRDLHHLTSIWRQVVEGIRDAGDLEGALADFMAIHGGRGQTFVPLVSDDVWETQPDDLLAVLPALAAMNPDVGSNLEPTADLHRSGPITRRLSEIATERDWMAFGYEQATRVIRNAIRLLGTRWADTGRLGAADDVMHLHLTEIEHVAAGGQPPARDVIGARRAVFGRPHSAATTTSPGEEMLGVPAAPGKVTGIARVVTSPAEFASLRPGEILVCQMTSPAWMPLLMIAGAVVSDLGGILSHAAIVAREFGIPAVTGTGDATARMISGSAYLVDGDDGLVRPRTI